MMFGMGGFELFVLVIGIIAAVLGYRLAKRRNREAWLWAVLSIPASRNSNTMLGCAARARPTLKEKAGQFSSPGHMHSTLFPTPAARLPANQPQTACRGSAIDHPKARARP